MQALLKSFQDMAKANLDLVAEVKAGREREREMLSMLQTPRLHSKRICLGPSQ